MSKRRTRQAPLATKSPGSYHHGDLRQALVDAAYAQVERAGADSLSLAQLAKSLGVSQPAPYRHFPDRNALLAAVATRGFREFAEGLRAASQGGDRRGALSRMGLAYVEFGTRRAGIYRLMFASSILLEGADPELGPAANASFALLVAALDGRGSPAAREQRALRIWVGLHGAVMLFNQGLLRGRLEMAGLPALVEGLLAH